jgi:hypothetical protein
MEKSHKGAQKGGKNNKNKNKQTNKQTNTIPIPRVDEDRTPCDSTCVLDQQWRAHSGHCKYLHRDDSSAFCEKMDAYRLPSGGFSPYIPHFLNIDEGVTSCKALCPYAGRYNGMSALVRMMKSCRPTTNAWVWGSYTSDREYASVVDELREIDTLRLRQPLSVCDASACMERGIQPDDVPGILREMDGDIGSMLSEGLVNLMMEPRYTVSSIRQQRFTGNYVVPQFLCCNYTPHSDEAGSASKYSVLVFRAKQNSQPQSLPLGWCPPDNYL